DDSNRGKPDTPCARCGTISRFRCRSHFNRRNVNALFSPKRNNACLANSATSQRREVTMKVKICGITPIEAATTAAKAGADVIGFVLGAGRRQITAENARKIAQRTSSTLKKVGVFVSKSAEDIETIVQKVGLDYVQLHG